MPIPLVVLDTDAWSFLYTRRARTSPEATTLRARFVGRRVVIATQTAAEIRSGAAASGLNSSHRQTILGRLADTPVVPVSDIVVDAYVELASSARGSGHALWQKHHRADCWVAATAIALEVPLVALDGIYRGAPGLTLL